MKVVLLTEKLKVKRAKIKAKKETAFYKKSAKLEILSMKLYQKNKRKIAKSGTSSVEIDKLIAQDQNHLALINSKLKKKITRINPIVLAWRYLINFLFGFTFSLRVLERIENNLVKEYINYVESDQFFHQIIREEKQHSKVLEGILENRKLEYISVVVLGLNDAIVEMTAAIAGFTFSLPDTKIVYFISLITGLAAAMSMGASSFLSARQDKNLKPFKAALLTGGSYLITVFFLTLPYILIKTGWICLIVMVLVAILIVFIFNYYISVAKRQSLSKNFFTMAIIALVISGISIGIGTLINKFVLSK